MANPRFSGSNELFKITQLESGGDYPNTQVADSRALSLT